MDPSFHSIRLHTPRESQRTNSNLEFRASHVLTLTQVYDCLVTLPEEVRSFRPAGISTIERTSIQIRLVWSQSWTAAKVLYFACRYMGLIDIVVAMFCMYMHISEQISLRSDTFFYIAVAHYSVLNSGVSRTCSVLTRNILI